MLTFLHSADFHLDSPFGALPSQQAKARRQELRELVFRMADYVNQEKIPLVLLAGDLFDSAAAYLETCEQLSQALGRMEHARIFIAPGNHDWYAPNTLWTQTEWPENVYIFQTPQMESVELPEWNAVIHGAAFQSSEQTRSLLADLSAPEDGKIHIGLLHGEVDPPEERYNPIRHEEIAASNLHYLALGHIHRRGAPHTYGRTVCAWPGCPEGRGFDELGEKGFYRGVIDNGQVDLTFVPFARRRYQILEVDVTGRTPREAVESALPEDTESDFYRILLTGESGAGGAGASQLEAALADRFCALEIRDQTRLAEDIWARSGEDSLRGLFLREMKTQWSAAETPEERDTITLAVRFGLAALDHRELG